MFDSHRLTMRALVMLLVPVLLVISLVVPTSAQTGLKDTGTQADNEYVSPSYGMSVEWSDDWVEAERSTEGSSVVIPTSEYVLLQPESGVDSFYFLSVYGHHIPSQYGNAEGALDHFEESLDQAVLEELFVWAESVEVLDIQRTESHVAALIHAQNTDNHTLELREIRVNDNADYAIDISLSTPVELFSDWYEGAQQSVEVDGDSPFTYYDDDEVLEIAASIPAFEGGNDPVGDDGDEQQDGTDANESADAVLADVRDHVDELSSSVDEFVEFLSIESLSQSQADRANEILQLWLDAPTVAAGVDLSPEHAEIEQAYLDYTNTMADAADAIIVLLSPDTTDAQANQAVGDFQAALDNAAILETDLDDLLTAAGA